MKFIIPIFILFFCLSCDSSSKTKKDNSVDSLATTSSTQEGIVNTEETTNEPVVVGTDSILFRGWGTEPFWGVEVRKSGIVFSISGMDSTLFAYSEPISASSRPVEYFRTYFLEHKNGKKAQLVVKKGEDCGCSDGMSEDNYAYHVFFLYDTMMMEGCGGEAVTSK